jgi:hypothetical protein
MITYNIHKSLCHLLGIDFLEILSLSDQELNKVPSDCITYPTKSIPAYPILKGKNHPMYGKKHTEEAKRKMSISKAGIKRKPLTEEHKNKLRKLRPHAGINISNGKAMKWIVIFPDNHEEDIINLNKFCRDNNLATGNLYKTVTGEIKRHKGFAIRHA